MFDELSMKEEITRLILDNYNNNDVLLGDSSLLNDDVLDIYLPKLNLAFEICRLYNHSELYKDKNYHIKKADRCKELGVQIVFIWEDDWIQRKEVVKSMIFNKLGINTVKIYARKCQVKEIKNSKIATNFLDENHVQGHIGSYIKLGLYHGDELVSLMTIGKKRKFMNTNSVEGEYELLRYCNKRYTNVVGGASKLFKYFVKNYDFNEITTFADRSYSDGNLYEVLGFTFEHKTNPNYYYIVDGNRKHRFGFRKDVLVKQGFDANMTEHEIMLSRKLYRIFNPGNYKYHFRK